MSFDWGEYLRLAKSLARTSNEAELRSSISRAYYAVFNTARRIIVNKGLGYLPTWSHKDHKKVPEIFEKYLKAVEISEGLKRLRNYRNKADYDDVFPNLIKTA